MTTELILKLALIGIDWLIKDQREREEIKHRLMLSTSRYHKGVLDSAILRREWREITHTFDNTPGR
jgi:hypothetical protein